MTKAELEKEVERLKEEVEVLELRLDMNDVTKMKTEFVMKFYALFFAAVTAIQSIFIALGKESPFSGNFAWWLFAFAVIYLIGYLLQLAMHMNKSVNVKTKISKDGADIEAAVDESSTKS